MVQHTHTGPTRMQEYRSAAFLQFARHLFAILIIRLHKIQNMANTAQTRSEQEEQALEAAILQRIDAGEIFEDMDELSPMYCWNKGSEPNLYGRPERSF